MNIQFKGIFNNGFPENSLQKLIQKIEFVCVQFNKIFIQLEIPRYRPGLAHPENQVYLLCRQKPYLDLE